MGRGTILVAICMSMILATAGGLEAQPRRARGVMPAHRTIDINVFEADVHNVMRLLAEVSGANFVIDDDVKGKVTARLRRVPWLKALSVILKSRGLEAAWDGNIIRVARRQTLAAERKAVLTRRQACLQHAPLQTRIFRPSYALADKLAPLLKSTLSPRGTIQVDQRTNTLIVRDVNCPLR